MCPHQVLCVPMCPVSGSGVAQGAVMGLSPPGGEFSEVPHLARRRWRHRPRRNPRPAPLLMAHFRPSLVITQYLHCAAHKPQVTCVLLYLLSQFDIYLEPSQLAFHFPSFMIFFSLIAESEYEEEELFRSRGHRSQ